VSPWESEAGGCTSGDIEAAETENTDPV